MKKIFCFLLLFAAFHLNVSAQTVNKSRQFNVDKEGVAMEGYDPVAYFNSNKPIKGKNNIIVSYQGVIYKFSTEENRKLFVNNPLHYQPEFGGWCAYAMGAKGEKVSIDPETFKILNGKLYLFYNSFFNNTLKEWNKNEEKLRVSAEKNWIKFNH